MHFVFLAKEESGVMGMMEEKSERTALLHGSTSGGLLNSQLAMPSQRATAARWWILSVGAAIAALQGERPSEREREKKQKMIM